MQANTILVVVGAMFAILVVIGLVEARSSRARRRPKLTKLSPESRERYVTQWDRVESRFVDSPDESVREADALLLALLGERRHPLSEDRLPDDMRKARREGKGGTEGKRQALLHYRAVMEEYARPEERTKSQPRQEMAS